MSSTPPLILAINPGSTSTRIGLFEGTKALVQQALQCAPEDLARCPCAAGQVPYRTGQVLEFLGGCGKKVSDCDAIAARGGPLRGVPGGVYRINAAMLADAASDEFIEHVSKIACIIAGNLARPAGIPAYVVDPDSTDEFNDISRVSGLKEMPRRPVAHALNLKCVARTFAAETGRPYERLNLITVQLGGGISIAIHSGGLMIDSVDSNGEGPFSAERSGGLRVDDLSRMVIESGKDFAEIRSHLTRRGGLASHLGTTDARLIEQRVADGDAEAESVVRAMAYAVSKHVCGLAAAVCGRVDGVLITGGMAHFALLTQWITERVSFLGPVKVYPDEKELDALADGALRVISGAERARTYPTGEFE